MDCRKSLTRVLLFVMLIVACLAVRPAQASGDFLLPADEHLREECGQFWASSGAFQASISGDTYTATLYFTVTTDDKIAMRCVASGLELDFHIFGFRTPPQWDGYQIDSNLPGRKAGPYRDDGQDVAIPRISGIKVSRLTPGKGYYASISFSLTDSGLTFNGDGAPRVSFEWVPTQHGAEVARVFLSDGFVGDYLFFDDGYYVEFGT